MTAALASGLRQVFILNIINEIIDRNQFILCNYITHKVMCVDFKEYVCSLGCLQLVFFTFFLMRNSANHVKIIKLYQLTFCLNSDQSVSGSGEFWQGAIRPPDKSAY